MTVRYVSEYIPACMTTKRIHANGLALAAWRKRRGFTQCQAARRLGISQGYYCKLEAGLAIGRPETLKTLHRRTGIPWPDLLGLAS